MFWFFLNSYVKGKYVWSWVLRLWHIPHLSSLVHNKSDSCCLDLFYLNGFFLFFFLIVSLQKNSVHSLLLMILSEQKPQKRGIANLPWMKEDSTPALVTEPYSQKRWERGVKGHHSSWLLLVKNVDNFFCLHSFL